MNFNDWSPKRRLELQFQRELNKLGLSMQGSIEGLTDPFEILSSVKSLFENMVFYRYSNGLAEKVVEGVLNANARSWREAARESSNGRLIYEALRKELQGPVGNSVAIQIDRNAEIIRSLPLDISKQITKIISEESMKGRRSEDIAKDILSRFPDISKSKAALIARTEVSKTSTALTQARCENIDIPAYIWRTSEDSRVRSSHRHMDGVIVFWRYPPSPERLIGGKNPPEPYHAGNIYNCRCYPQPLINLNYVKWPHKVYWNGTISMMTRAEFEKIA
ncbi:minor capsid protein [Desulfosporosinus sp. PR]|uniref:phage head morphogenesis protein n=1 Tax=Candidatus Desulfosporosinus nitrosoreducens TaxID=3401928 RepID=UPI0027F6E18F|nr:phage minor head protein [Desulfosporosinus sp. PR]MDQ7094204.1 minor capsid protein [Desulfosporosinus sp. PR]